MCEGIVEELRGIDLGDPRWNERSTLVLEALAAHPEARVNAACDGWSDTLAAYRLFNNDSVTPEQILRPQREATQRRMREHPVVLIVQDTTELDFTKHPTDDARCLNTELRFGLYDVSDRSQSRRHIPCAVHRIPGRITVSRTALGVCLLLLSDTSV